MPELGYILAEEVVNDGAIRVYRGNFFSGEAAKTWKNFDGLDALLEAGWVGD